MYERKIVSLSFFLLQQRSISSSHLGYYSFRERIFRLKYFVLYYFCRVIIIWAPVRHVKQFLLPKHLNFSILGRKQKKVVHINLGAFIFFHVSVFVLIYFVLFYVSFIYLFDQHPFMLYKTLRGTRFLCFLLSEPENFLCSFTQPWMRGRK